MSEVGEAVLAEKARVLADAVGETLPRWVERSVERVLVAATGRAEPGPMADARDAGRRAGDEVGGRLRALLETDVDQQRENPLAILRAAVAYPTDVLRRAGVPPVDRDDFATARFPDDDYDLTPASFGDVDPSLADPGLEWGAAKAWVHRRRHQ
ncbi:MAG TPA: hypothetical protein VFJ85_04025 [Acidimicrobiales bacterium]|nr:hypothetical protein [Acidimicrobiales bacterium]